MLAAILALVAAILWIVYNVIKQLLELPKDTPLIPEWRPILGNTLIFLRNVHRINDWV